MVDRFKISMVDTGVDLSSDIHRAEYRQCGMGHPTIRTHFTPCLLVSRHIKDWFALWIPHVTPSHAGDFL